MIKYTPVSQQRIEGFETAFEAKLSATNRWVELGKIVPWDKLAQVYYRHLEEKRGRGSLNARIAIGGMIIKHKLNLSDRETVAIISENPYMQHFLGLDVFEARPLFDASLFVKLRKRMGAEVFDEFTTILIEEIKGIEHKKGSKEKDKKIIQEAKGIEQGVDNQESGVRQGVKQVEKEPQTKGEEPEMEVIDVEASETENNVSTSKELSIEGNGKEGRESQEDGHRATIQANNKANVSPELSEQMVEVKPVSAQEEKPKLKGKIKLDATVADIYIAYPTDLDLLAKSREWSEKIIDTLYKELDLDKKPRTYRKVARKSYLTIIKKKKKHKKALRQGIRIQLNCLKRNFWYIDKMQKEAESRGFILPEDYQKYYQVIQQVYQQQQEMYQNKSNSCQNRIVSLAQPYVRPIVRGKSKAVVEFGPKLGLSLVEGYTQIDTLSWEAYHEGEKDFKKSVESYYQLYGYYPELVQVDRIYATRENRRWAKEKGIRMTAKALGRPKKKEKEEENAHQRRKRKQEHNERNQIEGKIGQGKQGYGLNQIKTKTSETAASWIGCIIFVMNIIQFSNDKKNKKGRYFLCFIQLLVYRTEEPIYSHQSDKGRLLLPYAA